MYIRILIFIIALAVLFLFLRSVFHDLSQKLRESMPHKTLDQRGVEEPASVVETTRDKMVLRIVLPDVTSKANIKVKKLSRSIEVRAYAGNKVYFKIFPVPVGSRILSKRMVNGEFVIEISRGG